MAAMNLKRSLIVINRVSAWILLVLMMAYIVTGYAWSKGIIMSRRDATRSSGIQAWISFSSSSSSSMSSSAPSSP